MRIKTGALLLLVPLIVLLSIFVLGLISSVLQGFGYIPAFGLTNFSFDYYAQVLGSQDFLTSLGLSMYVALSAAVLSTLLGTLLSFALIHTSWDKTQLFTLIKLPMFFPWMLTGFVIIQLFSSKGWFVRLFFALGFSEPLPFSNLLFESHHLGVILAFVWACTPFASFMIHSNMQNISNRYAEAATNLGASLKQNFFQVTLPLARPIIRDVFLLVLLTCFGAYEIPLLLGLTKPRALSVEAYYQFLHVDMNHRPYAMALNTLFLLAALGLSFVFYKLLGTKRSQDEN